MATYDARMHEKIAKLLETGKVVPKDRDPENYTRLAVTDGGKEVILYCLSDGKLYKEERKGRKPRKTK